MKVIVKEENQLTYSHINLMVETIYQFEISLETINLTPENILSANETRKSITIIYI